MRTQRREAFLKQISKQDCHKWLAALKVGDTVLISSDLPSIFHKERKTISYFSGKVREPRFPSSKERRFEVRNRNGFFFNFGKSCIQSYKDVYERPDAHRWVNFIVIPEPKLVA